MKRLLLIGFLLCAHGAFAATQCVPNIAQMNCDEPPLETYSPDVESICTNGSITATVRMMGICASDSGDYSIVADTIHISNTTTENTHCWCRMLKPAVSKWVTVGHGGCASSNTCASACRLNGYGNSDFRNAIINNLI